MRKKLIITTITIILILTTINIATAIPKIKTTSSLEETNKHFLCKRINSSGTGLCTANEPMLMFDIYFISIDYPDDPEANTTGESYMGLIEFNITGPHRIVTFFFKGETTLNPNHPDQYCEINGKALYLEIFKI